MRFNHHPPPLVNFRCVLDHSVVHPIDKLNKEQYGAPLTPGGRHPNSRSWSRIQTGIFSYRWKLAMAVDELQRILNHLEPLVTDRLYDCKDRGQTVEELHQFLGVPRAYVLSVLQTLSRKGRVIETGGAWKVVDP